ncbi:conserved hypothetical protein [Novosphingobium aromaticivorans DSM 12444]|uniref:Transmembrane anchor protein n=1 Tax=Novosphingobium aromaticivorans (strain ATCC 700278 / DSM 12444 / CCUG 56034 / CIP 105152 / NBRC 16084 / F199) TaxID=279238 RepID=Q2G436_NOVAD|nr:hypothetical protein [Novosphingobium aromaticivorans]ABD27387.1 conserved hypothetical protein [Novosphingobium aromaticivorans DSM 12444]SCY68325.1 hypothetical protein SAMN05660666_02450 [Novosphingobium aromaticivorans]
MNQTIAANPVGSIQASPGALTRAVAGAALAAASILVLFVLPAEYGIDPTGVGRLTGIAGMATGGEPASAPAAGPVDNATAPTAAAIPSKTTIERAGTPLRQDEMTLTLAPHSGQEVKAHMTAGDSYVFEWSSEGGPVKADMHGEKANAAEGEFTSYWEEKQMTGGRGNFTAPFDGTHGWYFRNKGETPVTVKVRTVGFYKDLFLPKGE